MIGQGRSVGYAAPRFYIVDHVKILSNLEYSRYQPLLYGFLLMLFVSYSILSDPPIGNGPHNESATSFVLSARPNFYFSLSMLLILDELYYQVLLALYSTLYFLSILLLRNWIKYSGFTFS